MSEEDVVENYDEFGMCLEMTEENRVRKFECTFFFSHVKPWRIAYYIAPYFTLSPLQGWEKIGKCKVEMLLLSNELSEKRHYAVCRYLLKSNHL